MDLSTHYITLYPISIIYSSSKTSPMQSIHNYNQEKLSGVSKQSMEAAKRMSLNLINLIGDEIESDQQDVSQQPKDFKLKNKLTKNDDSSMKRLGEVLKVKQQMQMELSRIQKEEEKIKNSNPTGNTNMRVFKSQLTKEDINTLKQLKRVQQLHQIQLQNKTKQYLQNLRKFQEEEQELLQKQRKQENQQRLKEAAKKIQQIRQRNAERALKMEEEKKKIAELKAQKKLYEKMAEEWKIAQIQQERKKGQQFEEEKKGKIINFDDIKQHQKKYEELMKSQREERERKMGQLSKNSTKKYFHNKLLEDVKQQQQKHKKQLQQKKIIAKEYFQKKNTYAEMVRTNFRPSHFRLKEEDDKQKQQQGQMRSMSVADLYKMGNQYMKQAKQQISTIKRSNTSKVQSTQPQPKKYKNYLSQLKADRKSASHSNMRYLQQIDNVMKKQSLTQQQKFFKAKMIAHALEQKQGKSKQAKMIESINAKIHLLKQISIHQ